jgi:hypothetical protein
LRKKKRVQVGSVLAALHHVGQTFELAGHPDPRRPPSSKELHLAIPRLLSTYRNANPATESHIALPVEVIADVMKHEGVLDSPGVRAAADLILVAFYYLLRVGKYTKPTGKCVTRTTQFRLQDVTFWKDTGDGNLFRLPFDAVDADILAASAATLTLDNQKNAVRDSTLHHEAVPGPLDPVHSLLARLFIQARKVTNSPAALLCQYSRLPYVQAPAISRILRRAAVRTKIADKGFAIDRIGSHSLWASSRAMALFLNDVDPTLIRKLGRWQSDTWLTYIHNQIAELTRGLSKKMVRPIVFHNVAAARTAVTA